MVFHVSILCTIRSISAWNTEISQRKRWSLHLFKSEYFSQTSANLLVSMIIDNNNQVLNSICDLLEIEKNLYQGCTGPAGWYLYFNAPTDIWKICNALIIFTYSRLIRHYVTVKNNAISALYHLWWAVGSPTFKIQAYNQAKKQHISNFVGAWPFCT